MTIKEFENFILEELEKVIIDIVENNLKLPISAKARAGAEISNWLEEKFVEKTKNHEYFKDSESAPKNKTKNPWDAKTVFKYKNIEEEIWIDFKAFKITSADTNPDIGSPKKIFKLINEGNFYLAFIHVFYQANSTGLEFVKHEGYYTKSYFLKDISSTFRRNPKNQLQVNISAPPEYRTREKFIKMLISKIKESHKRQIEISNKELNKIDKEEKQLLKSNGESEKKLIKKLE